MTGAADFLATCVMGFFAAIGFGYLCVWIADGVMKGINFMTRSED